MANRYYPFSGQHGAKKQKHVQELPITCRCSSGGAYVTNKSKKKQRQQTINARIDKFLQEGPVLEMDNSIYLCQPMQKERIFVSFVLPNYMYKI